MLNYGISLNPGPIWFLIALFVCKNIYNVLSHLIKGTYTLFGVCTILAIIGFGIDQIFFSTLSPFCFTIAMVGLFWYSFGNIWHTKNIHYLVLAILMLTYFICFPFGSPIIAFADYPLFPLNLLGGIGGTIIMFYISKWIEKNETISNVLSWCGENSLNILCIHAISLNLGIRSMTNNYFIQLIILLGSALIGTILIKYLKYSFNKIIH